MRREIPGLPALRAGRLMPGTQRVESRLAGIFGVTRERVRKVLHRLGHERLLEMIVNRSAFVASPSLDQAREIYEARRIAEGGIAGRLTAAQTSALRAHNRKELAALKRCDRAQSIRLSGEFHTLPAKCTGSASVLRRLQELVSRTSLLVAFFEPAASSECACEEHEDILGALLKADAGRVINAIHTRLSLIKTRLTPHAATPAAGSDADSELGRVRAGVAKAPPKPAAKKRPPPEMSAWQGFPAITT